MNKRHLLIAVGLTTLGALAGFGAKAIADGIPSPSPLYYAGTLTENGALASGARTIGVNLYADMVTTTPLCQTVASNTNVSNGRFRIALATGCKAAINANPNAFVEVADGTTSLGRSPIGAVPFAVEADHAVNATNAAPGGALATTISTLQGRLAVATAWINVSSAGATIASQFGGTWLSGAQRLSTGEVVLSPAANFFAGAFQCVVSPTSATAAPATAILPNG